MDHYLATIRLFSGDYVPDGWLPCIGQLMKIEENTALYSLVGNTFGGSQKDGTFGIPDMRTVVPLGYDPERAVEPGCVFGSSSGQTSVELTSELLPQHTHPAVINANDAASSAAVPANGYPAIPSVISAGEPCASYAYTKGPGMIPLSSNTVTNVSTVNGGTQGHMNMQPYLGLYYIICVRGLYPPRQQ